MVPLGNIESSLINYKGRGEQGRHNRVNCQADFLSVFLLTSGMKYYLIFATEVKGVANISKSKLSKFAPF